MNAQIKKIKKPVFILVPLLISFALGFTLKSVLFEQNEKSAWKRATEIIRSSKSKFNVLSHDKDSFGIVEIRQSGYTLINPLLDCYQISPPTLRQRKVIEDKLNAYIQTAKDQNKVIDISVYYRDLSNGPWVGINEDELFSPASLLKVPLLIAALKYAEYVPEYLSRKIKYKETASKHQNIITGNMIVPGQTYTIQELLEHMIIYSDNEAALLIFETLEKPTIDKVYYDLGIDIDADSKADPDKFISCREYAGFLRILYNATYLNKEMSEHALQILVKSTYMKGIAAGLPAGTIVADKFGERNFVKKNIKQLHNCGIVYLDNKPYILCVMTRGKEFPQMEEVISTISRIIYENLISKS